jgi:predicted regulator of Ras-like GTPase activity (Roadblock/LC7/MglB family)
MAISRAHVMNYLVRRLKKTSKDIEAVSLVTTDGLTLVTTLDEKVKEEKLSAISANIIDIAARAVSDLDRGSMNFVQISSSTGNLYLRWVDQTTVLALVVNKGANWKKIQLSIQRTLEDLIGLSEEETSE